MREKNVGEVKCMASGCRPKFSIIACLIVSLAPLDCFSLFRLIIFEIIFFIYSARLTCRKLVQLQTRDFSFQDY